MVKKDPYSQPTRWHKSLVIIVVVVKYFLGYGHFNLHLIIKIYD